MTDIQKEQIKLLRLSGLGYVKIAKELGVSVNTIKSYCRRNENTHTCLHCGKEIRILSKVKPRKFCSDACRYLWWTEHKSELQHKNTYSFTCQCCGETFTTYRNRPRRYCSHPCYIKARYETAGAINE